MRPTPTDDELEAFKVVQRFLPGVTVDPSPERQGSGKVDAHLVYPDGHRAALEVTRLVGDRREMAQAQLLAGDNWHWTLRGLRWWWTVEVPANVRLDKLRALLPEALAACERAGVTNPQYLHHGQSAAVEALLDRGVAAFGNPESTDPASKARRPGDVDLTPPGIGGLVGESDTDPVGPWLTEQIRTSVARKVRKLVASGLDERHLFLILNATGAPFHVYYAIAHGGGRTTPQAAPEIGPDVTHAWLVPEWSQFVLTWSEASGWGRHAPNEP